MRSTCPHENLEASDHAVQRGDLDQHSLDVAMAIGVASRLHPVQVEGGAVLLQELDGSTENVARKCRGHTLCRDQASPHRAPPRSRRRLALVPDRNTAFHSWKGMPVPPRCLKSVVIKPQQPGNGERKQELHHDRNR